MSDRRAPRERWYLTPTPPEGERLSERLYPEPLRRAEAEHVGRVPRVGVGLSGGGIRSATLSLGFFQGLAQRNLLRHVDVLSTVSGGGYFGAFLGHLVRRSPSTAATARAAGPRGDERAAAGAPAADESVRRRSVVDDVLRDPEAPALRFLRDNGRYLAPQGAGDLLSAGAVVLRNWVSILVVLILPGLAAFAVALVAQLRIEPLVPLAWRPAWWVSPYFALAALVVPVFTVPPGWAYWLVRDGGRGGGLGPTAAKWLAPVGALAVGALALARPDLPWLPPEWLVFPVAGVAGLTVLRFAVAATSVAGGEVRRAPPHEQRNELTHALKRSLVVVGTLLLLGTVDTVARGIVLVWSVGVAASYAAFAAALGAFRGPLLKMVSRLGSDPRDRAKGTWLHYAAAALVFVGFLGGIAAVPHRLVWDPGSFGGVTGWPDARAGATTTLLTLAGVAAVLAIAAGRVWSFVNRSSMHALYEARLRRAYLGASNPARAGEGEDRPPLSETHPGDGMSWAEYAGLSDPGPSLHAPLHLVNVTINETVDGRSQVQQRDRKGVGMAIGPMGVSVGRTHHALWTPDRDEDVGLWARVRGWLQPNQTAGDPKSGRSPAGGYRVFPERSAPEMLDVGQWVAISGGAVSTGIGARTSLALSLLCGFFNVRLGYWWNSGVDPRARVGATRRTGVQRVLGALRASLPVQTALADEWLARFPGTSRPDWYLSDGGHFENLAGYELIRRRLPLIVICDNEQDEDYTFPGLANLVRKARTDMAADIDFLLEDELRPEAESGENLWPPVVGPLDSLRRGRHSLAEISAGPAGRVLTEAAPDGLSLGHAALARITYRDYAPDGTELEPSFGLLVYVKPTLDGDEPADVREYHRENPDFPHESTGDQFFDEAQWESYRRLGEHMAERLFVSVPDLADMVEQVSAGKPPRLGRGAAPLRLH